MKCDQDAVNDDRDVSRAQVCQLLFNISCTFFKTVSSIQDIVLRHLNVLLGFNQTEKAFSVPPVKLRASAVFNAYISALPHVLSHLTF